jgi:hypothetical protein
MNHETINALKFVLALLITSIFAGKFLGAYNTKIRNEAIDGCANQTFYQNEYTDSESRKITNREPQKSLYQKCLIDKGVTEQK